MQKLGVESLEIKVAAVCVYHRFVETARRGVEGSGIHVAAVSTGFPAGLSPLAERVAEIRRSVEAGADEIDAVITRAHVFCGKWQSLYDEIAMFKNACGPAHLKVILGTGDLLTLRNVARASLVAMMAGADFIKNVHRQGRGQRDASGQPGHDAPSANTHKKRNGGRIRRRADSNGEAVARMARVDEGRARQFLAERGAVPVWR